MFFGCRIEGFGLGVLTLNLHEFLVGNHPFVMHFAYTIIPILRLTEGCLSRLKGIQRLGVIDAQDRLPFKHSLTVLRLYGHYSTCRLHTQRRLLGGFNYSDITRYSIIGLLRDDDGTNRNRSTLNMLAFSLAARHQGKR